MKWILSTILGILCLLGSGCKDFNKTPVEIGIENQILHKGNVGEPQDLDPQILMGLQEFRILMGLYEGLTAMDPKDLSPVPGVAKSWQLSNDNTTYTFNLRDNAKWSNGDPVTAHDFVFSYKRALSRELGCPYAFTFYPIIGAEDYHKGTTSDFDTVAIKALDNYTLEIKLKHSVPYFLSHLSTFAWLPVHKATILAHGKIHERGTGWTRPGKLVSNGPFKLKEWNVNQKVVIERNPHYWDNDNVKLNEIHFYPIDNADTEERAYRTGQLHITEKIPFNKIPENRDNPELLIAPFFSNYAYKFNVTKPPFDNKLVRQAMSLSLNRQSIIDNITHKEELPAFSFVPPGTAGYKTTAKLHENVEEAQKLLAKAGYPNGQGFPEVTLVYNTSESHKSVAEALQHMWKKNLNIDVKLVNLEWKVYLNSRKGGDFSLIRFGWLGDYLDPNAFLGIFHSNSDNNFSGWSNKIYDKLIDSANLMSDRKQRYQYFDKAENILMEHLPVLPLYFWNVAYFVHPSVKNWHPNVLDLHPYKTVYLEKS